MPTLPPLRDQTTLLGPNASRELDHIRGYGHFQIHPGLQNRTKQFNIAFLYMTTIFPQMQSNRVGTGLFSFNGSLDRIRETRSTRLTQGGDVIDIDT